jgi:D-alanyl-D-alanine carboxypeptidase
MKRFRWVALFMVVNLCGCAVAVPPKYKIAVSKQIKSLPPNEWCSLTFTLTNTRSVLANPWIEARVLDAENNTVDERFVTFAIPQGTTDQRETIIYASCNRVRQVAITGNGQIVEPNIFAWKE